MSYLEEKTLAELRGIAEEIGLDFPKNIGKLKLIEKCNKEWEDLYNRLI